VEMLPEAEEEANMLSNGSWEMSARANSCVDEGAQVHFLCCGAEAPDGTAGVGAGGAEGGGLVAGLLGLQGNSFHGSSSLAGPFG
jgi:hypothetical protein